MTLYLYKAKILEVIICLERSFAYRINQKLKIILAYMNFPSYKIQLYRLEQYRTDPLKVLKEAILLHSRYPNRPEPIFKIGTLKYDLGDPSYREEFRKYQAVRKDWLVNSGLNSLNMDVIWSGLYLGSLGNHRPLRSFILAKKIGLIPNNSTVLMLASNSTPTNKTFFSYFEPEVTIISDNQIVRDLEAISDSLIYPLNTYVPIGHDCVKLNFFEHIANQNIQKNNVFNLKLKSDHKEKGDQLLRKFGVPKDAWYVTLHAREGGYRGEKPGKEEFRNTDISTYIGAIKSITDAGGWVFRMGDKSMSSLEEMLQVVDYANSDLKSEFMDVYLGATSKFNIASSSGYFAIPEAFGVPIIMTNCLPIDLYFGLTNNDLFLPKLLVNVTNGKMLTFAEMFSFPISGFSINTSFEKHELTWNDNTSNELKAAVMEMMLRIDGVWKPDANAMRRADQFKKFIKTQVKEHSDIPLKPMAHLPDLFLKNHIDLLS